MSVAVDDDLWSAVGDPTRRRMLDLLLTEGGGTATSLSEPRLWPRISPDRNNLSRVVTASS